MPNRYSPCGVRVGVHHVHAYTATFMHSILDTT